MEWSTRGACVTAEPELFFPIGASGPALDEVAAAKRICATCDVVEECRSYALSTRQMHGVWGGLDEDERRVAWRELAPAAV